MELCSLELVIIVRDAPVLVTPARPTQNHVLPISPINVFLPPGSSSVVHRPHLLVYSAQPTSTERKRSPAKVLQQMLAEILVPYYPLAGRIRAAENGEVEVHCNSDGAIFVEAHTNATLANLNSLDKKSWERLRSDLIPDTSCFHPQSPLAVQVTNLACGGFIVGLRICHGLCDAAGILQFLSGWAEFAGRLDDFNAVSIVLPLWGRRVPPAPAVGPLRVHIPSLNLMHDPQAIYCQHSCQYDPSAFAHVTQIELSYEIILSLRKDLSRSAPNRSCSSFEVVAAHLWRERARAIDEVASADKKLRLFFLADDHQEARADLAVGFYGLYSFNCQAIAKCDELLSTPLWHAVELIQAAKADLLTNFASCCVDFAEAHCPCGQAKSEVVLLTEIWKMNALNLNFGWGNPVHMHEVKLPGNVNVIGLENPFKSYDSLHVTMNNLTTAGTEKLRMFPADGIPSLCCTESKL